MTSAFECKLRSMDDLNGNTIGNTTELNLCSNTYVQNIQLILRTYT